MALARPRSDPRDEVLGVLVRRCRLVATDEGENWWTVTWGMWPFILVPPNKPCCHHDLLTKGARDETRPEETKVAGRRGQIIDAQGNK
jgi:hypothetical protein